MWVSKLLILKLVVFFAIFWETGGHKHHHHAVKKPSTTTSPGRKIAREPTDSTGAVDEEPDNELNYVNERDHHHKNQSGRWFGSFFKRNRGSGPGGGGYRGYGNPRRGWSKG